MSGSGSTTSSPKDKGEVKQAETAQESERELNVHPRQDKDTTMPASEEATSATTAPAGSKVPAEEAQGTFQESQEVAAAGEQNTSEDPGLDEDMEESTIEFRKSSDIQEDKTRVYREPRMRRR